jgi:type IV pilus assembly protein PilY1
MKPSRLISSLVISLLMAVPIASFGLDTDVYLSAKGVTKDDSPNVLLILDNSGSMTATITTREAYDPNFDYSTLAGNPGITTGRIYWANSSDGAPPSSNSRQWFNASKNRCEASKPTLAFPGGSGVYSSDTIVGYKTSSTQVWRDLYTSSGNTTDALMTYVDCKGDNGATDPYGYVKSTGSAYTSNVSQQINWSGLTSSSYRPRLYSANYMNYYHNSTLSVTKSRIQIAKDSLKSIVDANQNLRFGLMVFNHNNETPHGGRLVMKVDNMTDARRTAMKSVIDSINAETYTPLAETMWEAYRYLGGFKVDYGKGYTVTNDAGITNPAPNRDLTAENASGNYISPFTQSCQKAYIILITDGDPTHDVNADATTRIAGLPGIAAKNSGSFTGYTDISYLDELTGWMYSHDVYAGKSGNQTVVTYTIGFGSGISANGKQLLLDAAKKGTGWVSGSKTGYFTADDSDQLTSAIQAAIIDALSTTTSFVAPALSVNTFNSLFNRDEVYYAVFKPSSNVLWDGNIKKYKLCSNTNGTSSPCTYGEVIDYNNNPAVDITTKRIMDTAQSYWPVPPTADGNTVASGGSGGNTPLPTARNFYTYTGAYAVNNRTPTGTTDLSAGANAVSIGNAALTSAMLAATSAMERHKIIYWMLGYDASDVRFDDPLLYPFDPTSATPPVGTRWRMSDPMHSRPVAVTYGGTSTDPIVKLVVGSNDGTLHMVNENTGVEEWAFVPQELLGNQRALMDNGQGDHLWGMDGTPTFDIRDRSVVGGVTKDIPDGIIDPVIGDYVHAFMGMRRGGRNIYALDLTPTNKLTSVTAVGGVVPKLLWVIKGGTTPGYDALSDTWSKPSVTRVRFATGVGTGSLAQSASKTVLMFGAGYNVTSDKALPSPAALVGNAIFMADPLTGERLWWASGATSTADLKLTGMDYPIASDLTLMDSNGDNAVDRLYVGDVGGQLWRIDLSPVLAKDTNAGSSGHRLADVGCSNGTRPACAGTPLQNRRKFFYPPDVAQIKDTIYEATQSIHDLVTIGSGDREDPIDNITTLLTPSQEAVHNRIYVFRDYNTFALLPGTSIGYSATVTDANLYDATSNVLQNATTSVINTSGIRTSKGWYIDLSETSLPTWVGEKVLSRTVIFNGALYASTYTPANASTAVLTCAAEEGLGKGFKLNILNGAAVTDMNNSGTLTTSDRYITLVGGIPPEVTIIIRADTDGKQKVTELIGTEAMNSQPALQPKRTFWFH